MQYINNHNINLQATKIIFLVGVLLAITSCSKPVTNSLERCTIFGACIDIKFDSKTEVQGKKLISTIEGDLGFLASVLDSGNAKPMLRLNGLLRSGEWSTVNPSVFSLLKTSKVHYQTSQGYFNPARTGLLVKLWDIDAITMAPPPDKVDYEAIAKNSATMDDIELKGIRARSVNTNIDLEFGTLLHGYTADMIFDYLESEGAKNIRVVHGNTVRISTKKDNIHNELIRPLYNKIGATSVAMNNGEALSSCRLTGDDDHLGGPRYSTIFNPLEGKPAQATGAVVVVHQTAMAAIAACQALFIAGPEKWQAIAKSMSVIAAIYVPLAGKLEMTMAMLQRIEKDKQKN